MTQIILIHSSKSSFKSPAKLGHVVARHLKIDNTFAPLVYSTLVTMWRNVAQNLKTRTTTRKKKELITRVIFSSHVVFDPLLVIYVLLGVWLLSDVSYSDECRTKKYFQYAENMIPLFLAILKLNLLRDLSYTLPHRPFSSKSKLSQWIKHF